MTAESTDLLILSGGILVMMATLGVLKLVARRRALDARRALSRLRRRQA